MPLYEYRCSKCEKTFEVIQKFSDAPLTACQCGEEGSVERLISSPALQFKGSGWYITDYAKSGSSAAGKSSSSSSESKSSSSSSSDSSASTSTPAASTTSKD